MNKELLQQVLDALENSSDLVFKDLSKSYLRELAVNTLREAIAQPEQPAAPVAPIPALPYTPPTTAHDYVFAELAAAHAQNSESIGRNWQPVTPPVAQAEPIERQYVSPVNTVADLVNNLLILDQALPIYGAQYIDHPTRGRCAIAVDPTVSRERVLDSRWIGQGDALNAAVIWTRASQISPAEPTKDADSRDAGQAEGGAA